MPFPVRIIFLVLLNFVPGCQLLVGYPAQVVDIHRAKPIRLVPYFSGSDAEANAFAFDGSSGVLAVGETLRTYDPYKGGTANRQVRIFDLETRELIRTLPQRPGNHGSLAMSPDRRFIASGAQHFDSRPEARALYLWDALTGRQIAECRETYHDMKSIS